MRIRSGTCRTVVLVSHWAIKVPWGLGSRPIRGWLANRSEWRQRHRPSVCRPLLSIGHLVLVMPRALITAEQVSISPWDSVLELALAEVDRLLDEGATSDEHKRSSWGWFGDQWLLIDYDRSWERHDRGIIGWLYWGWQEHLGRKWAKLR